MIKLKDILTENNCEEKFGKILFNRFSKFYKQHQDEPDTDFEERVYSKMKAFIRGDFNSKSKDKELIKVFKMLLKCKGSFQGALVPENRKLFRGTFADKTMVDNYFAKHLDLKEIKDSNPEDLKKQNLDQIDKPYTYKPKSIVQSWTVEQQTGFVFMTIAQKRRKNDFSNGFPILYTVSKPNNTFLFNHEFTNMFHFDESEVIRIGGNIKVNSVMYYKYDLHKFLKQSDYNVG